MKRRGRAIEEKRFGQKSISSKETSALEQITRKIGRKGGAEQKDEKQQYRRCGAGKSDEKSVNPVSNARIVNSVGGILVQKECVELRRRKKPYREANAGKIDDKGKIIKLLRVTSRNI